MWRTMSFYYGMGSFDLERGFAAFNLRLANLLLAMYSNTQGFIYVVLHSSAHYAYFTVR